MINYYFGQKNVIVYFSGFKAPSIDTNLFWGSKNSTIYSPEETDFGGHKTVPLGIDFFSRKVCKSANIRKSWFKTNICLMLLLVYTK